MAQEEGVELVPLQLDINAAEELSASLQSVSNGRSGPAHEMQHVKNDESGKGPAILQQEELPSLGAVRREVVESLKLGVPIMLQCVTPREPPRD